MILYHCTWTRHVAPILEGGIKPLQTSNWVKAQKPLGKRYGNGEVFAFANRWDAIRWAAKMDWEHSKPQRHGTGTVAILTIDIEDDGQWELDDADPLTRACYEGPWLKNLNAIPAQAIVAAEYLTSAMVKTLIEYQNQSWGAAK